VCVCTLCAWCWLPPIWEPAVCSQLLGMLHPLLAGMREGVYEIVHPCGPGLRNLVFFVLQALRETFFAAPDNLQST
jgi:hypothetical protein